MDWPAYRMPVYPVLTPFHLDSLGFHIPSGQIGSIGGSSSGGWPTTLKAFYYPFQLTDFAIAQQLFFWVGATSSGDIDVGIYDSELNRIVSAGTTAMSATVNTIQKINITDTPLHPGKYLLGVVASTTFATVFQQTLTDELSIPSYAVYEQVLGAMPLPDPCVPVVSTESSPRLIVAGIQFASVM